MVGLAGPGWLLAQEVEQIVDATVGGAGALATPRGVAADPMGNIYTGGAVSDNVFRVSPDGSAMLILDASGDGMGNTLNDPRTVIADRNGNAYVAGALSDNVFKISAAGAISVVLDSSGDGAGNSLDGPVDLALDLSGNLFVVGVHSDNVFKVTPGGAVSLLLDGSGDGMGNPLDDPSGVATDRDGNVYVAGSRSRNAFRIRPGGEVDFLIGPAGDGMGNSLNGTSKIVADGAGNVYLAGSSGDKAFRIDADGTINLIIDFLGDNRGNALGFADGVVVDRQQRVYVSGQTSSNVFRIDADGAITQVVGPGGDGQGNVLSSVGALALDGLGNVLLVGAFSNNLFRLTTTRVVEPDLPPDSAAGDQLGAAVAVSGNRLAVGVPGGGAVQAGRVVIYRQDGQEYIEEAVIESPASMAGQFGGAVALDGDRLLVAGGTAVSQARRKQSGSLQAALLQRLGTQWTLVKEVQSPDPSSDQFGVAVALSGDMMIIGAPGDDSGNGAVHLFSATSDASLKVLPALAGRGGFGSSVAAGSGLIAVGSPNSPVGNAVAGSATLIDQISRNLDSVRMLSPVRAMSPQDGGQFGSSVALDGPMLFVGAPGEDAQRGAVYAFERDAMIVQPMARESPPELDGAARFGATLAAGAGQIVVGAPDQGAGGAVFDLQGNLEQPGLALPRQGQAGFGQAVSVTTGGKVAIGAPQSASELGAAALQLPTDGIISNGFE